MPHAYIAYERGLSIMVSRALFHSLRMNGVDAFMDTRRSFSYFDVRMIQASAAVVIVLTPAVALRLSAPDHPIRAEIATAIDSERELVPVLAHGFAAREHADQLPDDLRWMIKLNPVALPVADFHEAVERVAARIHHRCPPGTPLPNISIEDKAVLRRRTARVLRHGPPSNDEMNAEMFFDRAGAYPLDEAEHAIADLDRAVRLAPTYASAFVLRGLLRFQSGGVDASDAALNDFNTAIALAPDDAIAYNNRGLVHKARGDLSAALRDYDRALQRLPGYTGALVNRALVHWALGDSASAQADFDAALSVDPDFAQAYVERGRLRRCLGDLSGAAEDYEQAIALDPHSAIAFNNRGALRYAAGDITGAAEDCTRAIELCPGMAEAYLNRGYARAAQALTPPIDADLLSCCIDDLRQYLLLGNPNAYERSEIESLIADLAAKIR